MGIRGLALAVALALPLAAADLGARIRAAIDASPATRAAFWGIQVAGVESGRTLFALNAERLFVPASNTKLFTTALALLRLGPEHRFRTTVLAPAISDAAGRVPWLRLVGGGDPNLSARAIPYRTGPVTGNPLAAIEDLAGQLTARGLRRVDGDVIGDDTAYEWEPFPDGWSVDDPVWEYGAPVSALTLNDNAFTLSIRPGAREGDLALLELTPAIEYYEIDNRVRTGGERRVRIDREPGSRQLRLWGSMPLKGPAQDLLLGIDDPALYAARALQDALARRGVVVRGGPAAAHLFPNQEPPPPPHGVELARRDSAPLLEDLRITAKVSQNLHAELLLRAVAKARRGVGSRRAGLEEMKAFLEEIGVEEPGWQFRDGSGLSRQNLVTPAAVVRLLRYMHASPARESWLSLLPVGGQDGTLEHRFAGTAAAGRIRAKTGTLAHVTALSGYAERRGGRVAFSILVNNYAGGAGEVRAAVDRICMALVEAR